MVNLLAVFVPFKIAQCWHKCQLVFLSFLILLAGYPALVSAQQSIAIAPGDQLSIKVYGEPELSFENITVPSEGSISYPFIGAVRVVDKSEREVESEISRRLKDGYLLQPQVTVSIIAYRPIYVGGAVNSPGQKTFSIGMNVEKAITISGGFTDLADSTSIKVQRGQGDNKSEFSVNLDTVIFPGDVVTIGEREVVKQEEQYIYLYGEVQRPGRYVYFDDLSVEKAIVIAGGFGPRASKKKISISRGNPAVKTNKVPLNASVEPGDVITIGVSLF